MKNHFHLDLDYCFMGSVSYMQDKMEVSKSNKNLSVADPRRYCHATKVINILGAYHMF